MFEIESDNCEDMTCDQHQDRPTQSTLANDSLVRKIRAITHRTRGRDREAEVKS